MVGCDLVSDLGAAVVSTLAVGWALLSAPGEEARLQAVMSSVSKKALKKDSLCSRIFIYLNLRFFSGEIFKSLAVFDLVKISGSKVPC